MKIDKSHFNDGNVAIRKIKENLYIKYSKEKVDQVLSEIRKSRK